MIQSAPDALKTPNPFAGWATQIEQLESALVVPPESRSFHQRAGVLRADGSYCAAAALWRKDQEITREPPMPDGAPEVLAGRWLWGGVLWRHFGHFTVESTGRLWGLGADLGPVDGVLFIPKSPKNGATLAGFQKDFLALAGGVPKVLTEPTRVEHLIVPSQGFGIGRIILGTQPCKDFFRNRFARNVRPDGPDKLYISRSGIGPTKGALICETRLEQHLAEQGYEIFHPQRHDIRVQIARYRAARQVIASEGSAVHMFGLVAQADQSLAVVVRRQSKATRYIERHIRSFAGINPVMVNEVQRTWKPEDKTKPRFARGEPDLPAVQRVLTDTGFLTPAPAWPPLSKAEIQADLSPPGRPAITYRAVG